MERHSGGGGGGGGGLQAHQLAAGVRGSPDMLSEWAKVCCHCSQAASNSVTERLESRAELQGSRCRADVHAIQWQPMRQQGCSSQAVLLTCCDSGLLTLGLALPRRRSITRASWTA